MLAMFMLMLTGCKAESRIPEASTTETDTAVQVQFKQPQAKRLYAVIFDARVKDPVELSAQVCPKDYTGYVCNDSDGKSYYCIGSPFIIRGNIFPNNRGPAVRTRFPR